MPRAIHLESLLHRRVEDASGKTLGRIEEIVVNPKGEILEYHLGPAALLQRWLGRFASKPAHPVRIAWDQLDLLHVHHQCLRANAVLPEHP